MKIAACQDGLGELSRTTRPSDELTAQIVADVGNGSGLDARLRQLLFSIIQLQWTYDARRRSGNGQEDSKVFGSGRCWAQEDDVANNDNGHPCDDVRGAQPSPVREPSGDQDSQEA